ncbi:MAG: recombinase family protein [Parachlamydiaceae bacterium]
MKLSTWAKKQGISYRTAWRWFKENKLPVIAEQTETGTILVKDESTDSKNIAICARVSSSDQKKDLDQQIARTGLRVMSR